MGKEHILIVDDEADILEMIRYNLVREGYRVSCSLSGEEAVNIVKDRSPDLILLDLMLPGLNGFDVCKLLKNNSRTAAIPIIMLTARGEETDIVTGLELGADDYMVKPFSPKVLLARIRTVLRRQRPGGTKEGGPVRIHHITIFPERFEVRVDDETVDLTATEFHILSFLARHPGWVFTRSQIIDAVKGTDYPVTDRSVDVQIVGLRKKMKSAGLLIETVRGVGYRFRETLCPEEEN